MTEEPLVRDPHQDGEPVTSLTREEAEMFLSMRDQSRRPLLEGMTRTERASIVCSLSNALGPATSDELEDLDRFSRQDGVLAA